MSHHAASHQDSLGVRIAQFTILALFTIFALSVIIWVTHLIHTALTWQDYPSFSLVISVVAIPIFLTVLCLVHYVFWGLYLNREGRDGGSNSGGGAAMLAIACSAALLTAAPSRAADQLPDNPAQGWHLFVDKSCAACHAIRGVGGKIAPDLGKVRSARSRLDTAALFWNHGPEMDQTLTAMHIPRPTFTASEMEQLLAFIYLQGYFDAAPDADAGERVYIRAPCSTCHGRNSEGGRGPRLDTLGAYASPMVVATAIWNHGPRMYQLLRSEGIPYPTFTGGELLDLAEYLRVRAQPPEHAPDLIRVGNPNRGVTILEKKGCLSCHSLQGEGGTIGPDLGAAGRGQRSQSERVAALWNHGPTMWEAIRKRGGVLPTLTIEEMSDLSVALYFQGYSDKDRDPARGKTHYVAKGCAVCHGLPAEPRPAGAPDITGSNTLESDAGVVAAIWNHLPAMKRAAEEANRPWPVFLPGEMADLVAYLRAPEGR